MASRTDNECAVCRESSTEGISWPCVVLNIRKTTQFGNGFTRTTTTYEDILPVTAFVCTGCCQETWGVIRRRRIIAGTILGPAGTAVFFVPWSVVAVMEGAPWWTYPLLALGQLSIAGLLGWTGIRARRTLTPSREWVMGWWKFRGHVAARHDRTIYWTARQHADFLARRGEFGGSGREWS